ncbi:MAG: protein tyrosine phosphatase family protein [Gammaproteobacteria bacterium]|nr:protein tyrosine phosphatase family protein [Gammaproteobacteria bacterium]MDH5801462.1 protein tyrosine phosphatase family protein [Gammaproteobacteria bacterium]
MSIKTILNYLPISPLLDTAGQPNTKQLHALGAEGYRCVINLAMHNSDNAVAEEAQILQSNGISYHHIPVPFDAPQLDQFHQFCDIMRTNANCKTLVHCALNMRVSVFVALYRIHEQQYPLQQAWEDIRQIWEPDAVWSQFMETVLELHPHV